MGGFTSERLPSIMNATSQVAAEAPEKFCCQKWDSNPGLQTPERPSNISQCWRMAANQIRGSNITPPIAFAEIQHLTNRDGEMLDGAERNPSEAERICGHRRRFRSGVTTDVGQQVKWRVFTHFSHCCTR